MTDNGVLTTSIRKQRWQDFYDKTKPSSHVFLIHYAEDMPERPLPYPDKKQDRIEWAWNRYVRHINRSEWLDDDSIPYLDIYTGTEIFAEAFGCKVHRLIDNMPFASPLISKTSELSSLKIPDLDVPCLSMLFEIADELRNRAGSDAVLKMVDIQSPMGISALIWKKSNFYVALLENPEAVKELCEKVKRLLVAFLDEWFSRYGEDFVAHYPDYYIPKGITLSEDEVGVINERVFEELFLPELAELSRRYGGMGIHCCANARHQWHNFTKIPGFKLLNLVRPPDELKEAYSYFASHVAQMHSWCGDDDPVSWMQQQCPDNSRIVLQISAASRDQATELSQTLRTILG